MASSSWDSTIKIWNYETGECLQTLFTNRRKCSFITEGLNNTVISGSDRNIKIWNVETGQILKTFENECGIINYLKLIYSKKVAGGFLGGTIKILNSDSGELLNYVKGHTEYVYMLKIFNCGHFVSCAKDKTLRFGDFDLDGCTKTIQAHSDEFKCLLFMNNEDIITGSDDKSIKVWSRF